MAENAGEPTSAQTGTGEIRPDDAEGRRARTPPSPSAPNPVLISRRKILVGGAVLLAAGAAGGAGALRLAGGGAQGVPAASSPLGGKPTGTASHAPGASLDQGPVDSPSDGSEATEEPILAAPVTGPNRVARENQLRGTRRWELPLAGNGDAEAYASEVSVAAGEQIRIHISSPAQTSTVTAYRLGWYGGAGARPVQRWKNVAIGPQPSETTDPVTGMVRTDWTPAVTGTVPDSWVSGLYLVVVEPAGGAPQYCSFVVREATPTAPILMLSGATTHNAYNSWGGKSLYPGSSSGVPTVRGDAGAVVVSFDRPDSQYRGAGLVLRWEYPFARWMESGGYDVAYAADLDLDRHPEIINGRKLIVLVGHPEYWSIPMRATLEAAIAAGTNVASFAGNEMYWRVRFEDHPGGRYRSVTCYRRAELDPLAASDPEHATVEWRYPPAPKPESLVLGQMYGHIVLKPGDFVCSAPDHWLFAGTGMVAGDSIPRLVGQEYDAFWPDLAPPGTQVLSTSSVLSNLTRMYGVYGPFPPNDPSAVTANATIYTAPSGATVFAAGTTAWSWGLDDWGNHEYEGYRTPTDRRVGIMTANVLNRLGR